MAVDSKIIIVHIRKINNPLIIDGNVSKFLGDIRVLMGSDVEDTIMSFSGRLDRGEYFNNTSEEISSVLHLLNNVENLSVLGVSTVKKRSREPRPEELYMKRIKSGVTGMLPPLVVEKQYNRSVNAFETWKSGSSSAISYGSIKCPFCTKSILNAENGGANNYKKHLKIEHITKKICEDAARELLALL